MLVKQDMIKNNLLFSLFFIPALFGQSVDINNKIMLAQNFERAGEFQKAKIIYEEVYRQQPENPVIYQALNEVYLNLKEYASSENLLKERIAAEPANVNLFGLLGKTLYLNGKEEQTYALWKSFLKNYSGNQHFYKIIANYALEIRNFDFALEFLKEGKNIHKDPRIFSYDLANLYSIMMQYKEAAMEYAEILKADPNQLHVVESRMLQYSSKPEMIEATIAVFMEYDYENDFSFAYILEQLYFLNRDYKRAFSFAKIIDESLKNGSGLFTLAQKVFSAKDYSIAAEIYQYLLETHPSAPFISSVKLGLAKTLEAVKDEEFQIQNAVWKPYSKITAIDESRYSSALNAYNELIKIFPNSEVALEAQLSIAKIYFKRINNYEKSLLFCREMISKFPLTLQSVNAMLIQSEIFMKTDKLDEAIAALENIHSSHRATENQKQEANFLLMNINFYKGDFFSAKNYSSLLTEELTNDRANDAIEFILLANTKMNDSLALIKFASAAFELYKENYAAALALLAEISNLQNSLPLQQISKLKLAQLYIATDDYNNALLTIAAIIDDKMNMYADEALYLRGKIYFFGLKDFLQAKSAFEQLLIDYPDSIFSDEVRDILKTLRTS